METFRENKDRPAFNALREIYRRGGAGWANLFAMCYSNGGLGAKTARAMNRSPLKCDAKTPACLEACKSRVLDMLPKPAQKLREGAAYPPQAPQKHKEAAFDVIKAAEEEKNPRPNDRGVDVPYPCDTYWAARELAHLLEAYAETGGGDIPPYRGIGEYAEALLDAAAWNEKVEDRVLKMAKEQWGAAYSGSPWPPDECREDIDPV